MTKKNCSNPRSGNPTAEAPAVDAFTRSALASDLTWLPDKKRLANWAPGLVDSAINTGLYQVSTQEVRTRMNLVRFIGLLVSMAWIVCGPLANAASLDDDAFKSIPIGKTAKFSDLSSFDAQVVCLLQPYQDRLPSKDALTARVNMYLAANNYVADEGHFAFVLVGKETIEIAPFRRSEKLDVLAKHEVSSSIDVMLPKGYTPHDCASGESAGFMKIGLRARSYVVLGELR
ncbi:hypothetical protein OIU25_13065 [Rhizobium sp. BT-175]|nr:hypothetical protein [Rhizobium sp. BT-175]MCV9943818.1 hypothetical protein [Rhizobium sp. BT-175]MCW0017382.1 hypothetical protein [Rhizobium sp. BT-226]